MLTYYGETDTASLNRLLEEEILTGQENLDAMLYLSSRSRQNVFLCMTVLLLLLGALGFLIVSLTTQSSRFLAPVFEPFVVPVCVMLCFLLYTAYAEYQRLSTELHQLGFFARRLKRAITFANGALGTPKTTDEQYG